MGRFNCRQKAFLGLFVTWLGHNWSEYTSQRVFFVFHVTCGDSRILTNCDLARLKTDSKRDIFQKQLVK